jgi:hypothetical protein
MNRRKNVKQTAFITVLLPERSPMMRNVTKSWWIENGEMSRKMLQINDNLTSRKVGHVALEVESDCAIEAAANLLKAVSQAARSL